MKLIVLSLLCFLALGTTAQVGVNTNDPQADLDVNGTLRVQDMAISQLNNSSSDCPCLLITDADGNISKIPIADFTGSINGTNMPTTGDNGTFIPPTGIKDKHYGDGVHDFIYMPIQGPDGRTWLNNNLGADYANIHSPLFDPLQQATGFTDFSAAGSLFQWQRAADGHELIYYSTSNYPTGISASAPADWTPGNNKFITANPWSTSSYTTALWGVGGDNNPCPEGFHVPTLDEMNALLNALNGTSTSRQDLYDSTLKFSTAAKRNTIGGVTNLINLQYWTSTNFQTSVSPYVLSVIGSSSIPVTTENNTGQCIRCISDD